MRNKKEKIILLGGGGHSKVLIELIRLDNKYRIAGILDPNLRIGDNIADIPVIGGDDLLPALYGKGVRNACIAVGSVKDNSARNSLYKTAKSAGFIVPPLIHPRAVVSGMSEISEGVQVMANAVVQPGCFIGENTIINTGAVLEHDCRVGEHAHISSGSVVSGGCHIGEGSFIGSGSAVIQGIHIGKNAVVAAGAAVVNNVPDNALVKGVPAK
ncbi:MAG: acetyltransferase [Nitrospiraceae bacterium]|nr:MAG: acetyltransferase [Nitrospiraceae bacterium]